MTERRAWTVFESLVLRDVDELSPAERQLVSVCSVRQEINSGGFDSYFRTSYGDTAPLAIETATAMGSPELAALIAQAVDRLGLDPYPSDCTVREDAIDDFDVEFDDLDEAYYALERDHDLDALTEQLVADIG